MNTVEWRELAEIKEEFAVRDWFMGTSGNLSIRKPGAEQFLITASGKDKRKQTSEDFILVGLDGRPAAATDLKPSAETLLHTEVYRKTEANCVLHIHTIENNVISELFAERGEVTFKNHEIIKATGRWGENDRLSIPIIQNHGHIPVLAEEFTKHIQDHSGAVLIRNHGITVWGRSGLEAKRYLEACEFLFQYQLMLNQQKSLAMAELTL
nr:methylthioribulose 1-phosphate dehydratase [Bacillus massiliglaciei]